MNNIIFQAALKNAIEHNGIANIGSVMGLVMSPQYKHNFSDMAPQEITKLTGNAVTQINQMELNEQEQKYNKNILEESKKEIKKTVEDPFLHELKKSMPACLGIRQRSKVMTEIWNSEYTFITNYSNIAQNHNVIPFIAQHLCARNESPHILILDFLTSMIFNTTPSDQIKFPGLYFPAGDPFTRYIVIPGHDHIKINYSLIKTNDGNLDAKIVYEDFDGDTHTIKASEIIGKNTKYEEWLESAIQEFITDIVVRHIFAYIFCKEKKIEMPYWYQENLKDDFGSYIINMPHTYKNKTPHIFPEDIYNQDIGKRKELYEELYKLISRHFGEEVSEVYKHYTSDIQKYERMEFSSKDLTETDIENIAEQTQIPKNSMYFPYSKDTGTYDEYVTKLTDMLINKKMPRYNGKPLMQQDEPVEPVKEICGEYKITVNNNKFFEHDPFFMFTDNMFQKGATNLEQDDGFIWNRLNLITYLDINFYPDRLFYFKMGDRKYIHYMNWTTGEKHSIKFTKFLSRLRNKIEDLKSSDKKTICVSYFPVGQDKSKRPKTQKEENRLIASFLYRNVYEPYLTKALDTPPEGESTYIITISTDPRDILKKSTGQGWTSCEELGGIFNSGCVDDIRVKNAIAYMTKENSDRWIVRVMTRWGYIKTDNHDRSPQINIAVEPDTYGSKRYGNILSIATRHIITKKGYMNFNKKHPLITPYIFTGSSLAAIDYQEPSQLRFIGKSVEDWKEDFSHLDVNSTKPVHNLPAGMEFNDFLPSKSTIKEKRWEIEDNNWEEENEPNDAWASQDVSRPNDLIKIVLLSAGIAFIATLVISHNL